MTSHSRLDEVIASDKLPSPKGVALQVIQLTQSDDVTNQQIAYAIKADPVLSGHLIKAANALVAYQTRPIASVVDAVAVLGMNTVRQLALGLSLIEHNRSGPCAGFDYQNFWTRSLLTGITAQNLVLNSGIGSAEEIFMLGLLGQIGSLALAATYPLEYARVLAAAAQSTDSNLCQLELDEFGFDHNQLTQTMLAEWGMPQVFQNVARHHEDPKRSGFTERSRNWHLVNMLHIADMFSRVCTTREQNRRKMVPRLILIATRLGIEMETLARVGDKSVHEWHEWSRLCGIRTLELPPFATLLEAIPLAPGMLDAGEEVQEHSATAYKLRILLVDDDRGIRLLLTRLLERAGHTVETAGNGVEGLEKIANFKPQLIITDWMMPEMDGIEFCKALRQNKAWRNIYVFIMTAQEGGEKLVEAFEAGANDYMTKPISHKLLLARLRAGQRVVQLQDEMEFDRQQLHKFADELAAFNQRLRKSDVSMRAILDNSPYMAWLKDAEGRYIRVNKSYARYVKRQDIAQIIGKTDFDFCSKKLAEKRRASDIEVISHRQQKRVEESLQEEGRMRWLETFRTPVIDENGNVLGVTGFVRDITERKQTEAELRVAAIAFESQEGMFITDPNTVILKVNHAFTEITGYTAEEVIGQTPRVLKSGHHDKAFYAAMWDRIARTGVWQGEIWNRRKSGEVYPEQQTITAVKGEGGEITHYVATLNDITLRKASEAQIHNLAYFDALTQLPNRRLLNDRLKQAMAASKRSGFYGAVMFLDLDNFKPLNDTYGHSVGDLLLIEAARRIVACVRETDTVSRFGGDEFVVILNKLDGSQAESATQAATIAEKIRIALAEPYQLTIAQEGQPDSKVEHLCTSSIGVALFIGHETSQQDILKITDMAMYQAKEAGRNRVVLQWQGRSDAPEVRQDTTILRLNWHESYDCGEATIDREHRQLFELANALIESAFIRDKEPERFAADMDKLITHVAQHFADEEAILAQHHYNDLNGHGAAHQLLIKRALQLRDEARAGHVTIGELVNFIADDVVSQHMLKLDRNFYPLFKKTATRID